MARVRQPEAEIRPPLRRRQVVSVRIARDPGAKDQYRLATQAAFGHLVITKSGQEAPKRNGKSCAEKCLRVVKRGSPPNVDKRRREAESLWALIVFVGCPKGFQQPPKFADGRSTREIASRSPSPLAATSLNGRHGKSSTYY